MRAWLRRYALIACAAGTLPASAQFTLTPDGQELKKAESAVLQGKNGFDLIPITKERFTFPLRKGNIIAGSVRVELDGKALIEDKDYSIDLVSGTLAIRTSIRIGQSLRVQYRYDETKKQTGEFGSSFMGGSSSAFNFQLSDGAKAFVGMGITERREDGTIVSTNVFGMNNSFKLGSGSSMNGFFMLGQSEKEQSSDLITGQRGRGDVDEDQGSAIVQELSAGALGGTLKLNYQDVDSRFTSAQAFVDAGANKELANNLVKEAGLKRSGFQLANAGVDGFRFGAGLNTVGDDKGKITWRNTALNLSGIQFNYSSQYVDQGFNKFNNIRESDAQQLMKEKGLKREAFGMAGNITGGKLAFDGFAVTTDDGSGIYRNSSKVELPWLKVNMLDQRVDREFTRFNDLRENDRGQLAKERGMSRFNYDVGVSLNSFALNFNSWSLKEVDKGFNAMDVGLSVPGFSVQTWSRSIDDGFNGFNAFAGGDHKLFASDIVAMYGSQFKQHANDVPGIRNLDGTDRNGFRIGIGDAKNPWLNFNQVTVGSEDGGINLQSASAKFGPTELAISSQQANGNFNNQGQLLFTEQNILGTINDLNKTNFGFKTSYSGTGFSLSRMAASDPSGGAFRESIGISRKNFNVSYNRRSVDQEFNQVGRLIDPERQLLQSLLGFDQTELIGDWQVNNTLKFGFQQSNGVNSILDQTNSFRNTQVNWNLSKNTSIQVNSASQTFSETGEMLHDQQFNAISVTQKLGNGALTVSDTKREFNGLNDPLPSSDAKTIKYEHQLDKKTSVSTEQTKIDFADGSKETQSANSVSTKLTDRFGLSVTDVRVNRDGELPDEARRDYGFWIDFGSGIKLNYGYKRNLKDDANGGLQSSTTLSGGEAGGIKVDGASYNHNRIDGQREQHLGNVSLSSSKPFQFGVVQNFSFYYRTNTQKENFAWRKEDLAFGAGMSLGQVGLGYDYLSQINPSGARAIDRTFTLSSDRTNKDRLRGEFKYGVRTTPDDKDIMIRDYKLAYQTNKNFSVEHSLLTNPTQQKNNVLLGTAPIDERKSSWNAKYQNDSRFKFDLSWNETKRLNTNESLRREAKLNMTLFANNPSPIDISYGLQQWDRRGDRSLAHAFGLTFNQRPGPNQSFSFSLERLNWIDGRPDNTRDWGLRLDYGMRF